MSMRFNFLKYKKSGYLEPNIPNNRVHKVGLCREALIGKNSNEIIVNQSAL